MTRTARARRRLPAALACGVAWCSALAAAAVAPGWLAPESSPQIGENSPKIKVLSLNLLQSNEKGRDEACRVVRRTKPDVVWFVEYTPDWQRHLRAALPELPHRLERPDFGSFGAALYSRHPFSLQEMVPGGHMWSPFGRAVVETEHGPIGVLGVHPPPPLPGAARVAERDRGLAVIPGLLDGLPPRRIVLGDFNATPWKARPVLHFQRSCCSSGSSRSASDSRLKVRYGLVSVIP